MSSLRSSFVRSSRLAARSTFSVAKTTRPLSTSARLHNKKHEVISEREVPVSSYNSESNGLFSSSTATEHTTIPVESDPTETSAVNEVERVVPLTRAVYEKMSPMMQKMTVMDKIVVITG